MIKDRTKGRELESPFWDYGLVSYLELSSGKSFNLLGPQRLPCVIFRPLPAPTVNNRWVLSTFTHKLSALVTSAK
jgi:hypothetical protein